MKLKYNDKQLSEERLQAIDQANTIIEEYDRRGMMLTLRQLYYQHVARGLIENTDASYGRLQSLVNDARLAGLISWTSIEDRTRNLMGLTTHPSVASALGAAAQGYRSDLWKSQRMRPEVWVEKEALAGVVGDICNRLRVDYYSCRGYNSQSEQWRAGQRFARYVTKGQQPIVLHLGDHDPSGLDMTRDNQERLSLFAGVSISVVRLALNWEQVERLRPPPNPAKMSDSRARDYVRRYGHSSWELDALDPSYIQQLISDYVAQLRNEDQWGEALAEEVANRQMLMDLAQEFRTGEA